MELVVDFVRSYIETEYQTLVLRETEANQTIFEAQQAELAKFSRPYIADGTQRTRPPNEKALLRGKKRVENGQLIPRPLFQIKQYQHPQLGRLYRAYLGLPTKPRKSAPMYDINLFIIPDARQYNIISRYIINLFPEQRSKTYLEDNNLFWDYQGGVILTEVGVLEGVEKFLVPRDAYCILEEYNAE